MTVSAQAFANASTGPFQLKKEGYIDDLLTSSLIAWQLAGGYALGELVRGWLSAAVL